jgi:hypothetical protein
VFAETVRTVIFILIGLIAVVVLTSLLLPGRFWRSYTRVRYICTACGLRREDEIQQFEVKQFGGVTYRHRITFEQSALSRVLGVKQCRHSWLLSGWYGHGFRGLRVVSNVNGGYQSQAVPELLGDDQFARDLAGMENPGKTWGSLVAALNSDRSFDKALLEWLDVRRGTGNGTFSTWAVTNGYWSPSADK